MKMTILVVFSSSAVSCWARDSAAFWAASACRFSERARAAAVMAASTSLSKVSTRCWRSLMERAWSAVREALEKVSSSTKTALVRRSFWRDSRFDDISVRFVIAPLHRSPFSFSPVVIIISLPTTSPRLSLPTVLLYSPGFYWKILLLTKRENKENSEVILYKRKIN